MRDQVQWEVEGRDPGDGTDGEALHETPASGGKLLPVERKVFAVNASSFFSGDVEDKHSAIHFDARQLDGLAGFQRQSAGEFVAALGNGFGNAPQHALALEGGQTAGGAERFHSGGNGGFGVFAASLRHSANYAAVVRRADFDNVAVLHPPAVDEETVGCDRNERQFRHWAGPLSYKQRF